MILSLPKAWVALQKLRNHLSKADSLPAALWNATVCPTSVAYLILPPMISVCCFRPWFQPDLDSHLTTFRPGPTGPWHHARGFPLILWGIFPKKRRRKGRRRGVQTMAKDGSCLICQNRPPMPLSLCLHYSTAAVNHYLSYCEVEQSHGDVDSNSSLSYETHWLNLDHMLSLSYNCHATMLWGPEEARSYVYYTEPYNGVYFSWTWVYWHKEAQYKLLFHALYLWSQLFLSELLPESQLPTIRYQFCPRHPLMSPVYYHSIHWLPM